MNGLIAVVGLGLIGGSASLALRGFGDYTVVGVDVDADTLEFARTHGVADVLMDNAAEAIADADVVFLCLHPEGIIRFLHEHRAAFKAGALVTDVCGVKTAIMEAARVLPPEVDFIGCHPMAGKETSGVFHAEAALFENAHCILTVGPQSLPEHVDLLEEMARYMGFRDIVHTTAEQHDGMIAYTSQVMHVLAAAVCDDPDLFACRGFEGGSFRDCTRVAALDVPLWTELFSLNAPALTTILKRLEENLRAYRTVIEGGDRQALAEKLTYSANRKRQMNLE